MCVCVSKCLCVHVSVCRDGQREANHGDSLASWVSHTPGSVGELLLREIGQRALKDGTDVDLWLL